MRQVLMATVRWGSVRPDPWVAGTGLCDCEPLRRLGLELLRHPAHHLCDNLCDRVVGLFTQQAQAKASHQACHNLPLKPLAAAVFRPARLDPRLLAIR
jgi:hypothetical protein